MKIRNPNFVPAVDPESPAVKHRFAVIAALQAEPEKEFFSFADVRAGTGLTAAELPNAAIMQICAASDVKIVK